MPWAEDGAPGASSDILGVNGVRSGGQEEEPRLRYGPLGSESPRAARTPTNACRLCVSDKVLAVGHQDGSVQLLDHLGDQVSREGARYWPAAGSWSCPPAAAAAAAARCAPVRRHLCWPP